jgi:hypothetical protein
MIYSVQHIQATCFGTSAIIRPNIKHRNSKLTLLVFDYWDIVSLELRCLILGLMMALVPKHVAWFKTKPHWWCFGRNKSYYIKIFSFALRLNLLLTERTDTPEQWCIFPPHTPLTAYMLIREGYLDSKSVIFNPHLHYCNGWRFPQLDVWFTIRDKSTVEGAKQHVPKRRDLTAQRHGVMFQNDGMVMQKLRSDSIIIFTVTQYRTSANVARTRTTEIDDRRNTATKQLSVWRRLRRYSCNLSDSGPARCMSPMFIDSWALGGRG